MDASVLLNRAYCSIYLAFPLRTVWEICDSNSATAELPVWQSTLRSHGFYRLRWVSMQSLCRVFFYILYIHFIFPSVIRPPLRKAHIWVCKWMFKTSNLWVCGTVAYRGARPSRSVKHRGPSRSVKHRGPSRSVKHRSEKVELWQPHSGRRSCTHASIQSHPKQQCYVLCYVLVLWKYKHNTAFLCICMWILCTTNALNDQE